MKLTTVMADLEGRTVSLGLFGEPDPDGHVVPPHVQVMVPELGAGDRVTMRQQAIAAAIEVLEQAREALQSELE